MSNDVEVTEDQYFAVLYQRIRQARHRASLTQIQLADHLGLTLRQYQRLEASTFRLLARPSIIQLRQLAFFLHVDLGQLVAEPSASEVENFHHFQVKLGIPAKKKQSL